jgi:DNA-directed RNA polymerase subunit RPC12/RpoP
MFCEQCGKELNVDEIKKKGEKICDDCEDLNYWFSDEN